MTMQRSERETIARADDAEAILGNPLIAEALDSYEQELVAAWKNSKSGDAAGRESIHRMLQAQAHFRAYLLQVVTTGKLVRAKVRPPTIMERAKGLIRR